MLNKWDIISALVGFIMCCILIGKQHYVMTVILCSTYLPWLYIVIKNRKNGIK